MANKKFAEMTGAELTEWWRNHPAWRSCDASTALRDAIRAEALEETSRIVSDAVDGCDAATIRAERAERELQELRLSWTEENARKTALAIDLSRSRDAHNAAIRERDIQMLAKMATERALRTAESALGEARREGAREALGLLESEVAFPRYAEEIRAFRDREYPATPSGEGVRVGTDGRGTTTAATPQPEAIEVPKVVVLTCESSVAEGFTTPAYRIRIYPADAKRIMAMGQKETYL